MMELAVISILFITNIASISALILLKKKLKIEHKSSTIGDAGLLLRDLLNGDGIVRVTRISPEDVLLRSPRRR